MASKSQLQNKSTAPTNALLGQNASAKNVKNVVLSATERVAQNAAPATAASATNSGQGSVLSLDKFTEDGFEVADPVDIAELVVDKLLLEELYAALEELDPDNRRIMELFSIGKSEREIAVDIGLSQKAINKRKTKLFSQLRERLKDFI